MNHDSQALSLALDALKLISAPRRPDGTYNRSREACEQLACETLRKIEQLSAAASPAVATAPPAKESGVLARLSNAPRVASGETFTVFSDGACKGNPGPASWGVVVLNADDTPLMVEGGFLGTQTNQVAELMAALEGLRRTPVGARVLLVSDSDYTLKGISTWRKGWERNGWLTTDKKPVKNKEIWQALLAEVDQRKVATRWVKGHSGDRYNEMCDEVANVAVATGGPVCRT